MAFKDQLLTPVSLPQCPRFYSAIPSGSTQKCVLGSCKQGWGTMTISFLGNSLLTYTRTALSLPLSEHHYCLNCSSTVHTLGPELYIQIQNFKTKLWTEASRQSSSPPPPPYFSFLVVVMRKHAWAGGCVGGRLVTTR